MPEATRLFRYHKPKGVVTAARDPEGRATIYDTLPEGLPRLMPVGRLDIGSEGLLLLTNDGGLKRKLELPATGWLRRYRVRAFGTVDDRQLKALAQGVTVDGIAYGPIQAQLDRTQGDNAWLTLSLREGKNREVRRVLEHVGLSVNRLIRIAYGPFQLGLLPKRSVEEVLGKVLREQVGALVEPPARTAAGRGGAARVSLRIIAGRLGGRRIETPEGLATRPTSERAREALFAMLEHGPPPLRGSRFLDLFAGSGAAGLEASSRGAARVLCVDQASAAVASIGRNIAALGRGRAGDGAPRRCLPPGAGATWVRHRVPRPALRQRPPAAGAGEPRRPGLAGAGRADRGRGGRPRARADRGWRASMSRTSAAMAPPG